MEAMSLQRAENPQKADIESEGVTGGESEFSEHESADQEDILMNYQSYDEDIQAETDFNDDVSTYKIWGSHLAIVLLFTGKIFF